MPTPHIESEKEDISSVVITMGDPLRAKYVAEKYLTNYKLVNKVRNIYAYTGFYKGKKITVMAHGMGLGSMGIYSYELFKFYDVDKIIRIGSCGSYTTNVPLRSVILVEGAYSKSNYAKNQNGEVRDTLYPNNEINKTIENCAKKAGILLKKGKIYSSDVFYNDIDNPLELYEKKGCLAVEMESFALFHSANVLEKKAACLLTVSDSIITKEELSSNERETSFNEMIILALESVLIGE